MEETTVSDEKNRMNTDVSGKNVLEPRCVE